MNTTSQNGNVLFIILIGIVLFAGLMYAFTESSQNSFSNLDREQAQIVATDILNYGQKVENGVQRLLARGCSELDISFENSISATDYTNVNSTPGEYDCHVFHPEGAGLTYAPPPANSGTGTEWLFNFGNAAWGVGEADGLCSDASCIDMVILLGGVQENVCRSLNFLSGITETLGEDIPIDNNTVEETPFNGTFPSGFNQIRDNTDDKFRYKSTGCYERGDITGYQFYHVLIAR